MALLVREPGLYTIVVDAGRPHTRGLGVALGGAADRASLALGNSLLGNEPFAPALECNLAGPTLEADEPTACAFFGAPFAISTDARQLRAGQTFTLEEGERLQIGSATTGMRGYLCVRGGFATPRILDSHSSLDRLRAGAILACASSRIGARWAPELEKTGDDGPLRVLPGPQAEGFRLAELTEQTFTVLPASNRMGLRLSGKPITPPAGELTSEPACPGSVQVTRDGQCIVLGVDGQTIGGYPRIAIVSSADLDRVGQLRPGDAVSFAFLSMEEARAIAKKRQAWLSEWQTRLRASLTLLL